MHRMHFGQHQASSAIYMYNNTCTCTCIVHVLSCSYTYMYMYTYMYACTYMYMYDQSLRQRQSKATMSKDKLPQAGVEPMKFCVLGRRSTYQLSHRGSSAGQAQSSRAKARLFPDKQGNSFSTAHVHVYC